MIRKFLSKIVVLFCVFSCNKAKQDINIKLNHNQEELAKYIHIDINSLEECTFEFFSRNANNSRISVGSNNYQLFAVLKYKKEDFPRIIEQIHKYKKLDNVYLDVNKVPKWFPKELITSFTKEESYYHLTSPYEPNLYLLKEFALLKNGFCYIDNNRTILLYLYST